MNFYKHYIGDFQRDTGHLSLTERGAYLALMHHYYATELPLPDDHGALCRIAGAFTKAEKDAVKAVTRFFTVVESGLMHSRIEAELEKAGKQADTNRRIAQEREAKRKEARESNESSTNRATNRATNDQPNQTPDTNKEKHSSADADHADRFQEFWETWPVTQRRTAKAECAKKWRLRKLDSVADQIVAHVAAMKGTKQWQDGFEPAPLTYLNQKRWEDGVVADGGSPEQPWEGAL
ncbi:YdaU family protein [Achromobacter insolitus]|uniref:YdaU family protein n=1 Tax=Achromobacter insolitus TaxID=217204 RepID=UPI002FE38275